MKNIIAIFLLSVTVACAQKEPNEELWVPYDRNIWVLETSMYHSPAIDHEIAKNNPYDVKFEIGLDEKEQLKLVAMLNLHGGSFFVSPNTETDFEGKFRVEIAPNNNLSIGEGFTETPQTETVIDPHQFVNGPVNWVTEDTRYDYPLNLTSEGDFEIGGKLIFVIEPKCTLEEVPIMFKYKSGVLTVEKWGC